MILFYYCATITKMKYIVIETKEDMDKACEYFGTKLFLGADTETTELQPPDGDLRLVQLSDGNKTVVIDVFHLMYNEGYEYNDTVNARIVFQSLKDLLENPDIGIIIHNSMFEEKWLSTKLGISPNKVFDTMIASQHVDYNGGKGHNLADVSRRYMGVDMDKAEQRSDWSQWILSTEQLDYAALDPYYLPQLREILLQRIQDDGLVDAVRIDFECVPAVAHTELAGLNTNRKKYEKEIVILEELRKTASKSLQNVLRPTTGIEVVQPRMFDLEDKDYGEVMLTSWQQVLIALSRLGVPVVAASDEEGIKRMEKSGKQFAVGTGEKALAPIAHLYPVVKLLNDFRGVDKMTTNYGHGFLEYLRPDGKGYERVYANFYVFGAETGRMAIRNPPLQTIPNGEVEVGEEIYKLNFRSCFDFPKGRCGVISDYSQIELRVVCEFSGDPVFMEAFTTGRDLHALTAATVFGLNYEDCANDKHDHYHKYRAFAKRVNFGIIYGIGAGGLSAQLKNSVEECIEILEKHRAGHPVLWDYLDRQKAKAKKTLKARTASGRLIRFNPPEVDEYGRPDRGQLASIARIGTNQPIQGTSADILKIALKLVHERTKGMDAQIVNIVHDEILMESEISIAEKVKEILQSSMVEAGQIYLKNVPVKSDAKIIQHWGEK